MLLYRGVFEKKETREAALTDPWLVLKLGWLGIALGFRGVVAVAIGLCGLISTNPQEPKELKTYFPSSPAVPPSQFASLFGPQLDDNTKAIIEKATQGKTLEENERHTLKSWLDRVIFNLRLIVELISPLGSAPSQGKTGP